MFKIRNLNYSNKPFLILTLDPKFKVIFTISFAQINFMGIYNLWRKCVEYCEMIRHFLIVLKGIVEYKWARQKRVKFSNRFISWDGYPWIIKLNSEQTSNLEKQWKSKNKEIYISPRRILKVNIDVKVKVPPIPHYLLNFRVQSYSKII